MGSILDEMVRCCLCETEQPVRDMTMNEDELWECGNDDACASRAVRPDPIAAQALRTAPVRRTRKVP